MSEEMFRSFGDGLVDALVAKKGTSFVWNRIVVVTKQGEIRFKAPYRKNCRPVTIL